MKNESSTKQIIALAYFHRYGWIAPALGCTALWGIPALCISFVVHSVWSIVGYQLKWKHIYCSYQNAYHKKMTPNRIRWDKLKKSDAYGIPIIFLLLGVALLLADIMGI